MIDWYYNLDLRDWIEADKSLEADYEWSDEDV